MHVLTIDWILNNFDFSYLKTKKQDGDRAKNAPRYNRKAFFLFERKWQACKEKLDAGEMGDEIDPGTIMCEEENEEYEDGVDAVDDNEVEYDEERDTDMAIALSMEESLPAGERAAAAAAALSVTDPHETAKLLEAISNAETQIQHTIAQALQPRDIEVFLPPVGISQFYAGLGHPTKDAKRYTCPISTAQIVDLDDFADHVMEKGNKPSGDHAKIQNAHRFFNIIDFPKENESVTPEGILVAVWKGDILRQIMKLPAMSIKYSWARSIIAALGDLTEFLRTKCERKGLDQTAKALQRFNDDIITNILNLCAKQADSQSKDKKFFDTNRLEVFPSVFAIKGAVKKAMVDLQALSSDEDGINQKFSNIQSIANTCLIGIIYYNGFAGRSLYLLPTPDLQQNKTVEEIAKMTQKLHKKNIVNQSIV